MSDELTWIEDGLTHVEDKLVEEFARIRNTLSAYRYNTIDESAKGPLAAMLERMTRELEHSGSIEQLTLTTERHEALRSRMVTLRQLMDGRLPTAYLEEAHEVFESKRRAAEETAERSGTTASQAPAGSDSDEGNSGLIGSLKRVFARGEQQDEAVGANAPASRRVVQETDAGPRQIYLDGSVYSARRELAAVAELINAHAGEEPPMPRGPAFFAAKDTRAKPETPRDIATSPEEIRRKLEARQPTVTGTSAFAARELSGSINSAQTLEPAQSPEAIQRKLERRAQRQRDAAPQAEAASQEAAKIAQTPEAIAEKLAERQPDNKGPATFEGKDIVNPNERYSTPPPPRPKKDEPEPPPTGKAVFEARDLTPKS